MGKDWLSRRRSDAYYRLAKKSGYRSRAAYKLIYINQKFGIFKEGDIVLDLGAAPGGWSQVAKEFVGGNGTVIGIDLAKIEPAPAIMFFQWDLTDSKTLENISELLEKRGIGKADAVISDMSPNISGNYSYDHAKSVALCERALDISKCFLEKGGNMVVKIFQGDLYDDFFTKVRGNFRLCKGFKSKASRAESSELYIVGKGFIL
jgi:23S rRNA (uridine2552-2'-O)-methyltransferase